jgi:hypothetical protein
MCAFPQDLSGRHWSWRHRCISGTDGAIAPGLHISVRYLHAGGAGAPQGRGPGPSVQCRPTGLRRDTLGQVDGCRRECTGEAGAAAPLSGHGIPVNFALSRQHDALRLGASFSPGLRPKFAIFAENGPSARRQLERSRTAGPERVKQSLKQT